jgi:inositol-phosphate phosphatase/L-galactose 1-phosphate phosphatase/histidinol-phosphatase
MSADEALAVAAVAAERMADAVRPIVLSYYRGNVPTDEKADQTPVTAADRDAETRIREMIEEAFPGHGILGEEHGSVRLDAEHVWVLDPIDGTKSFITGKPLFGTLIALLHGGRPVVGVIDAPALDERWLGVEGEPTTLNGAAVKARPCPDLAGAWLYATAPEMFAGPDAAAFERLKGRCRGVVYGADCYAYGLLANGTVDLVCEASTKPYDYCALVPVVRGAGGVISDWAGEPLGLASDGRVLAAGDPAAHAAALQILAG